MNIITCDVLGPSAANTGIGNQMFNVAAAYALAWRDGCEVRLPCLNDSNKYGKAINSIFKNVCKLPVYEIHQEFIEKSFNFEEFPKVAKNTKIKGYFQSEKYFYNFGDQIKLLFSPDNETLSYIRERYSNLLEDNSTVSVHVRRGDYVKLTDVHGLLCMNYYEEAMLRFPNHKFVMFSDDIEWCKENFRNCTFIEGESEVIDFYLMSFMKSNVIANSTFSWWSAWLNSNPDKIVIAPSKWFGPESIHLNTSDIIPKGWTRI